MGALGWCGIAILGSLTGVFVAAVLVHVHRYAGPSRKDRF